MRMVSELAKYIPLPGMNELYKLVVLGIYKEYRGTAYDERKAIVEQIEKLNTKLAKARELLFDEKLDHNDFAIMKKDCDDKIKRLEASLAEVKVQKSNTMSIDNMLIKAIETLSNLKSLYENGDALTKREVLGSIFREKLRFDGNEYRTPRLNEAAQLIYQINKKLRGNKNGKERDILRLSRPVLKAGIEPALALRRTGF